jgi:perosamine synthetase
MTRDNALGETSVDRLSLPSDQDASGRTLGAEELLTLGTAIRSGTLTSTKGAFVRALQAEFARRLGVRHCWACTSGTASIHTAVAAIDPEPGEEIITSPITDMGAITPILYQSAIPVFADVDPATCNLTAASVAAQISSRTRGIVVTHLFGRPCDMAEIMEVARAHNLPVIEDCAQAFGAVSGGQAVGTIGCVGCFSLQQGKHITTGEGGLVVTDDESLAHRMFLFINKAWGYGDAKPDHYFLAPNYRMNELTGAVALAQSAKLSEIVRRRIETANALSARLDGIDGITTPSCPPASIHSYWKYTLMVDPDLIPGGAESLGHALQDTGIPCAPRYVQKPAFDCAILREQRTFGKSRFPFSLARPEAVDYDRSRFPGTYAALDRILVLPWNERYTMEHVDYIVARLRAAIVGAGGALS